VPGEQRVHVALETCAVPVENVPAGQLSQYASAWPVAVEYPPAKHAVQGGLGFPSNVEYVPAGHRMHVELVTAPRLVE
jgi:hypothetical protein